MTDRERKSIVITGASRGLGLALFKQFISQDWTVLPVVRQSRDAAVLKEMGGARGLPVLADITDDRVAGKLSAVLKALPGLDVLVNNAGTDGQGWRLKDASTQDVLALFNVHCLGALRVTQTVMPFMRPDGIIVNVSSRFGSITKVSRGELDNLECSYSYRLAKAAQNMFTQCLCREFKDTGLRICSIHPGRLKTGMASMDADRTPDEAAQRFYEMLPQIEHGRFYDLFGPELEWQPGWAPPKGFSKLNKAMGLTVEMGAGFE